MPWTGPWGSGPFLPLTTGSRRLPHSSPTISRRTWHRSDMDAAEFAQEVQALVTRFPNAAVNVGEQRRLRASLYQPLLGVKGSERGRIVDCALHLLLGGDADADS